MTETSAASEERPAFVLAQVLSGTGPLNALLKNLMKQMDTDDPFEAMRKINSGEARAIPATSWSIENAWWTVQKDANGKEWDVAYFSIRDLGIKKLSTLFEVREAAKALGLDFCSYDVAPPAEWGKGYVKVVLCEDVFLTKHKETEQYSPSITFALCRPHKQ